MLLATVLLFIIFNIKGACSKCKWLNLLFMIPGILSFLPIFLNDHDMSTWFRTYIFIINNKIIINKKEWVKGNIHNVKIRKMVI